MDDKDSLLYTEFSGLLTKDTPLDEIFSRNRSFSKKQKRRAEGVAGEQDEGSSGPGSREES